MKMPKRVLRTKRRIVAAGSRWHRIPRKLPAGTASYRHLYSLFLKNAMEERKVNGKLIEIGPGQGRFLNFLLTEPAFARNTNFSAMGVEPNKVMHENMPNAAKARTKNFKIEEFVQKYPKTRGAYDFVITKSLFDEPSLKNPGDVFHAIGFLTRKGGKVFLQTTLESEMPSRELMLKEGFKIIDLLKDPSTFCFCSVLQKVK